MRTLCILFVFLACSSQRTDYTSFLYLEDDGLRYIYQSSGVELTFFPEVMIDGKWLGGDKDKCRIEENRLSCELGDEGDVFLEMEDESKIRAGFIARKNVWVEGIGIRAKGDIPWANNWISNGFQSWSQSGAIVISDRLDEKTLKEILETKGDEECMRDGRGISWWYSILGGKEKIFVVGAITAERLKSWVEVARSEDGLFLRFASGGTGEKIFLEANKDIHGETFYVSFGIEDQHAIEIFAQQLSSRKKKVNRKPQVGWNSWYELWANVDEKSILENADIVKSILEPYLENRKIRIVIDDGWEKAWGDWVANQKFPSGMQGLANNLKSKGFDVGIWIAPLLAHENSEIARAHPDWFIKDISYNMIFKGKHLILDITNQEARNHLSSVIKQIVAWGYDYLKLDFLFAGTYEGKRTVEKTGMQAYREALEIIRSSAGEDVILMACGAPPIPSLPYVDAWRVGGDIATEFPGPSWYYIVNQARSISARLPFCLSTLCDPDPVIIRTLPKNEVEVGSYVVALASGGFFLSDDLRHLEKDRIKWAIDEKRLAMSLSKNPFQPVNIFPDNVPETLTNALKDFLTDQDRHAVPSHWKQGNTVIFFDWKERSVQVM